LGNFSVAATGLALSVFFVSGSVTLTGLADPLGGAVKLVQPVNMLSNNVSGAIKYDIFKR